MAGAVLKFDGGYLGFERCEDPATGKHYLRAVIYSNSTGRCSAAPVEITDVVQFATDAVRQALLADGHSESELIDLTWKSCARAHA